MGKLEEEERKWSERGVRVKSCGPAGREKKDEPLKDGDLLTGSNAEQVEKDKQQFREGEFQLGESGNEQVVETGSVWWRTRMVRTTATRRQSGQSRTGKQEVVIVQP